MSIRRVESFVLRVVVQEDTVNEGFEAWRGRIQHITTGSERQFDQFQDMLAFIAKHLERDNGEGSEVLQSAYEPS